MIILGNCKQAVEQFKAIQLREREQVEELEKARIEAKSATGKITFPELCFLIKWTALKSETVTSALAYY